MDELDLLSSTFAGRRPSFGFGRSGPFIRGFRSRPGAPQAANDRMAGLSPSPRPGASAIDKGDWNDFFANSQQSFADWKFRAGNSNGAPQLQVPSDAPPAAAMFDNVNDNIQLPGDSVLPPGISRQQFNRETQPVRRFAAPPGSTAAAIENKYRTPGAGRGFVTFGGPSQPPSMFANVSDNPLPY